MPDKNKDKEPSPFTHENLRVERAKHVRIPTMQGPGTLESAIERQDAIRPSPVLEPPALAPTRPDNLRQVNAWTMTNPTAPPDISDQRSWSPASTGVVIVVDSDALASVACLEPQPRSEVSSPRLRSPQPMRTNGAYCLVRDGSGNLAPPAASGSPNTPPPSSKPVQSGATGSSGGGRHWSLVPSPVIAIEELAANEQAQSATPSSLRSSSTRRDPYGLRGEPSPTTARARAATSEGAKGRGAGVDLAAFDPSRAYPNAPQAQPFVVVSRTSKLGVPAVPSANAWRFRIGVLIFPALGAGLAWALGHFRQPSWMWLGVAASIFVGITSALVLIHRAWMAINDGACRTSPTRALLLLLVPGFNVYWAFHVLPGFATDYNRFIKRHQIEARPLSRNLMLAAMVPIIGAIFCWAAIAAICEAINSIRQGRGSVSAPPAPRNA